MGCQAIYVLSYNCCITYIWQLRGVYPIHVPFCVLKKSQSYIASQQIYVVQIIMCMK